MWLYADVKSLGDIPRYYGKKNPNKTALIGAGRQITFGELDQTSSRVASVLQKRGMPVGAHIGYFGKNSIEYFEVLFGVSKAGCAILPLNWRLSPVELQVVIDDAELKLVFVDREYREVMEQLRQKCQMAFDIIELDSVSTGPSQYRELLAQS